MSLRRLAWISGTLIALCLVALAADWFVAWKSAPGDARLVEALQEKVREDASLAPQLEAEQKRIAAAVLARKARTDVVSWIAIAALGAFLISMKKLVPEQPPLPPLPERLVRLETQSVAAKPIPNLKPVAPEIDLSFVDEIVKREGTTQEAAIPILQAIQAHYRYMPDAAIQRVCELTGIAPALLAGTSSFYSRFRRKPVGEHIVRVCHGTACHVAGARQITDELRRNLHIAEGEDTDPSRTFTLEEVACIGCCSLAPVLMVDEHTAGKLTPATACSALGVVQSGAKV